MWKTYFKGISGKQFETVLFFQTCFFLITNIHIVIILCQAVFKLLMYTNYLNLCIKLMK